MGTNILDIADNYFNCMRAGDIAVIDLFHDDAKLQGLGQLTVGKDAIRDFYTGVINNAGPSPRDLSPKVAQGNRVFAEILIDLGNDVFIHAIDVFEIIDGRIKSLTYFTADYPAE